MHGINPYLHGPLAIVGDPIFHYVGQDWVRTSRPPTGRSTRCCPIRSRLLGVAGALWAMKLEALLASVGTLVLDLALRTAARPRPGARAAGRRR